MRWAVVIAFALSLGLHAALWWVHVGKTSGREAFYLVEPRRIPLTTTRLSRRPTTVTKTDEGTEEVTSATQSAGADPSQVSVSDVVNWGNPPPDYPFTAIENGWQGTVEVRLRAGEVSMVLSSGHHTLDEAALRWARDCRVPADLKMRDILVPIVYRLDN